MKDKRKKQSVPSLTSDRVNMIKRVSEVKMSEYFGHLAMPASDRELIENFLKAVQEWAPTSLTSIILYGSIAKGIFPKEYDVDIVLLFSSDFDHPRLYSDVYRIIRTLEPHREMHVVLKWEGEIEPAYWELIEEEGIILYP